MGLTDDIRKLAGVPVESYIKPLVHKYYPDVEVSVYFGEVSPKLPIEAEVETLNNVRYMDFKVGASTRPEDVIAAACHELAHVKRGSVTGQEFEEYLVEEVYTWRDGLQFAKENNVSETYCKHAYLELEEIYGTIDDEDALRVIDEVYRACGVSVNQEEP